MENPIPMGGVGLYPKNHEKLLMVFKQWNKMITFEILKAHPSAVWRINWRGGREEERIWLAGSGNNRAMWLY